jgi:hypothetical protein
MSQEDKIAEKVLAGLDPMVDLKLKEMIAIIRLNEPGEKSKLIAELKEDNKKIIIHLDNQDKILKSHSELLEKLTILLQDKDFIAKIWKLIKQTFGGVVALASAYYLYENIKK